MNPSPSTGGLNWAYVLTGAAEATLLPYIPLYLYQHGLKAPQIGAVLAVAAAGSLVAGMGWAYLADRSIAPERAIVGGTVAAAVVVLMLPFARGAVALGAATTVLLMARAPFTLLDPIALQRLREENRTRYARIRLRMSAGWALSAVVSGGLFQVFGLRLMPFVYAPMVLIFGLWVRRSLWATAPVRAPREPGDAMGRRIPVVPVAMVGFLFACFLLGASSAAAQNFVTLQINVLGGGALLIGAAAAFQALTEIPTMGSTPRLSRRLSHKTLFAIGCGVYVLVFLAWALVSDPVALALLKLAAGVAFALTFVSAVLIADHLTPAHLRATGQALVKAVLFGLAPIAGSYAGGVVYGGLGARAMFLAATVVMAVAAGVAIVAIPASIRRDAGVEQAKPVTSPVRA
jgi:MFS transporter, PPP family, 3-phenylpropionic acid transporter